MSSNVTSWVAEMACALITLNFGRAELYITPPVF